MEQSRCFFCDVFSEKVRVLFDSEHFFAMADDFPVNKGHMLIVSKRHQTDIFSLNTEEWQDVGLILERTKAHIDKEFKPQGYNVGVNSGEAAGQTVFHLHVHVIARYTGDVERPRGGVRNFKKPLVEHL